MKNYIYCLIILNLFLIACQTDNEAFEIGEDLVESKTEISMVDSFSIALSTVKFDSIPTSDVATSLVGYFENEVSGTLEAQSYFNFDLPSGLTSVDDDAVFDSLTLQLYYSDYLLGDSTQMQHIQVHRLQEQLLLQDNDYSEEYLFNNSRFSYDEQPIGELYFLPQKSKRYEEFRLDDELGEQLLQIGKDESDEVLTNDNFLEYLKGFVLKADETSPYTIVGFSSDSIRLNLYTHITKQFEPTESVMEFEISTDNTHYNAIFTDRSGTYFENLLRERDELPSTTTGDKSYLQGSAGVMVRLDFPTLNELYKLEDRILLKAELILRPSPENSGDDLPTVLNFYETDKVNQLNSLVLDDDDNTLTANLYLDKLYNENSYYAADITSFLSEQLAGNFYDTNNGLLITVPYTDFLAQTDFLSLEGEKSSRYKPTLNLYFLTYE